MQERTCLTAQDIRTTTVWKRYIQRFGVLPAPHDEASDPRSSGAVSDHKAESVLLELQSVLPKGPDSVEVSTARCQTDLHSQAVVATKADRRREYHIGWRVENIPGNMSPASKLLDRPVPEGMMCLILEESSNSLLLASTGAPGAAVNLEFLSTALQVRAQEGTEPFFSLDPVDADERMSMQAKHFEPQWLAGTRAGEVMFQADYHLKELSMGEYEQPIVGMRSCLDYFQEEHCDDCWAAREWFMVKMAEVQLTSSNVLIPYIKMGVEAREQMVGESGLEDVPITRPGHPLVRYAEAFTNNFDLIAERKSVIFHLRELAKASVLAKFLVESEVCLEDAWYDMAEALQIPLVMEVPQVWNERRCSQVQLKDGELASSALVRRVYGGVNFGLEQTSLAVRRQGVAASLSAVRSRPPGMRVVPTAPRIAKGVGAVPTAAAALAIVDARRGLRGGPVSIGAAAPIIARTGLRPVMAAGARPLMPARGASTQIVGLPRGVDLNLDSFNLSEPKRVNREDVIVSWGDEARPVHEAVNMGELFWESLENDGGLKEENKQFLKTVFNPRLSDRREEGKFFSPPNNSPAYVQHLQELVRKEEDLRQQRKDYFFSSSFLATAPGPLFPSSWTPAVDFGVGGPKDHVELCTDYQKCKYAFAISTIVPSFDKSAEDGVRFRIYECDSFQVRTAQEPHGDECIGSVFSITASSTCNGANTEQLIAKACQQAPGDATPPAKEWVWTAKGVAAVAWWPCGVLGCASEGSAFTGEDFAEIQKREHLERKDLEHMGFIRQNNPAMYTPMGASLEEMEVQLVLQLRLPNGHVESILVGPWSKGIVILQKMLPLKGKGMLPEEMEILRPDGKELVLDKLIGEQHLHDGSTLVVSERMPALIALP